jgi:AcrR family transcriptional regulator
MSEETPARSRILDAAFSTFIEAGYTATTMLAIARRARVSKRELYAVVGNKQEMLVTCIRERSQRLRLPDDLPDPHDRASLEGALITIGTQLLRETTHDTVIAAFRLAIAEATHAPEVAAALDHYGRRTGRAALTAITTRARDHGLLDGDPPEMAERFSALLWGDLMTSLLLRVVDPPGPEDIARRATSATAALLRLHPPAPKATTTRATNTA